MSVKAKKKFNIADYTGLLSSLIAIVGGLLLIYPGYVTDVIGVLLVGGILAWQKIGVPKLFGKEIRTEE